MTDASKQPSTANKVFLYLPMGVRSEIERFRREHGMKSTSAAARAMLRFATTTARDADRMGRPDLYAGFVEAEQPMRLEIVE